MAKKAANTETAAAAAPERTSAQKRRKLIGEVVSNKMQKTITVRVDRRVKHPFYSKFVIRSKKYLAHDEGNQAGIGDKVVIVESRPLSARKRWALQEVLRKAGKAAQLNV